MSLSEKIKEYARAIRDHGIDSLESRRLRDLWRDDEDFIEYADTLDKLKRKLIENAERRKKQKDSDILDY